MSVMPTTDRAIPCACEGDAARRGAGDAGGVDDPFTSPARPVTKSASIQFHDPCAVRVRGRLVRPSKRRSVGSLCLMQFFAIISVIDSTLHFRDWHSPQKMVVGQNSRKRVRQTFTEIHTPWRPYRKPLRIELWSNKTCPFPPSCPSFHSNSFPTLSGEGMAAGSGTQNLSPPLLCPALPPWSRSIKSSESSRPPSVSAKPPSSFGSSLLPPFSFSRSLLRVLDRPTDPPLPSLTCYATCDSSEPVSLSVSSLSSSSSQDPASSPEKPNDPTNAAPRCG